MSWCENDVLFEDTHDVSVNFRKCFSTPVYQNCKLDRTVAYYFGLCYTVPTFMFCFKFHPQSWWRKKFGEESEFGGGD